MTIRGFKESEGGLVKLTMTAEDERDKAFLRQFIGQPLICSQVLDGPYLRVQIMPDLSVLAQPSPREKYRDKSADDLLDMLARRGHETVPRETMREDMIALLIAHENGDEDAVKRVKANLRQGLALTNNRVREDEIGGFGKAKSYYGG